MAGGTVALGTLTTTAKGDGTAGNADTDDGALGDYVLAPQPTIASVVGAINVNQFDVNATITAAAKAYDGLLAVTSSTVGGDRVLDCSANQVTKALILLSFRTPAFG